MRARIVALAIILGVSAPLALAAPRWPLWWTEIAPEDSAMTWLQSVVLVCAALIAALLAVAEPERARPWSLLAAGFAALAIDERFALHERIRDGWLAPRGVTVPFLPWVAPGDFLLLGVATAGLIMLPVVRRLLRADRAATRALWIGIGLAVLAVAVDSIDPSTWTLGQERVQQSLEECAELGSGLALLCAVLLPLAGHAETSAAHWATRPASTGDCHVPSARTAVPE